MLDFIKKELTIDQPIETVWKAITDPKVVSEWFGSHAEYELKEGAIGYFEWTEECPGKYAMQISTIKRPNYFAWYWMYDPDVPFELEKATLVEWMLQSTISGKTHLTLIESGFREEHHRKMNINGWNQELADLSEWLDSN